MENINNLRLRLAIIRAKQKEAQEEASNQMKPSRGELYFKEHISGMKYTAIARKYGVSRQAARATCVRYQRRMDKQKEGAEDG